MGEGGKASLPLDSVVVSHHYYRPIQDKSHNRNLPQNSDLPADEP